MMIIVIAPIMLPLFYSFEVRMCGVSSVPSLEWPVLKASCLVVSINRGRQV